MTCTCPAPPTAGQASRSRCDAAADSAGFASVSGSASGLTDGIDGMVGGKAAGGMAGGMGASSISVNRVLPIGLNGLKASSGGRRLGARAKGAPGSRGGSLLSFARPGVARVDKGCKLQGFTRVHASTQSGANSSRLRRSLPSPQLRLCSLMKQSRVCAFEGPVQSLQSISGCFLGATGTPARAGPPALAQLENTPLSHTTPSARPGSSFKRRSGAMADMLDIGDAR